MRAGPLSRKNVIQTLNRYFVPVYTSVEDYHEGGAASEQEKAEYRRIYREALDKKLSAGTVHAYVIDPAGRPIDSLHVADAARGDELLDMLRRSAEELNVTPGEPLVRPRRQAAGPANPPDGALVLHLVARAEGTDPSNTGWHGFPSENWIVLDQNDAAKLLPPAGEHDGWEIDRNVAEKILTHVYPQTENNDVSTHQIEQARLRATPLAEPGAPEGVRRVRLDGSIRMTHPFYPYRESDDRVDATVIGYMDFVPATGAIKRLRLATDKAVYRDYKFDVAVRSVP